MRPIQSASRILIVLIGIAILPSLTYSKTSGSPSKQSESHRGRKDLKLDAFEILSAKCNVCHIKKNPRKVFSLANMNALAPKIQKQVFIKKRMPKGKDIKLTSDEYSALLQWLETQNLND